MFGFFENEQTRKIKSHIMNLAALAKADGHIDEREMNFIWPWDEKRHALGRCAAPLSGNASTHRHVLPDNDSERFDQIFDLVDMMLADGIVDDTEMDFCMIMAEKLGFRKAIVGVLVRRISQGVKDGLPRDQIKDEALALTSTNCPPNYVIKQLAD